MGNLETSSIREQHMPFRFGVTLRPETLSSLMPQVEAAEALNYQIIGITESVALARDPWMALTLAAQHTNSVPIGTLVTNPAIRHPMSLAAAAATLEELAPKRTFIGIGSGFSGALNLGLQPATWAYLEEYVSVIRNLLELGKANFKGKTLEVSWPHQRIPIYVTAHGPKSIRRAARFADGVIMGMGISPEVIQKCLHLLHQGAKEAGRNTTDIDVWWFCQWHVDYDSVIAKRDVTWLLASSAWHLVYPDIENKIVPSELHAPLQQMANAYDMMLHGVPNQQLQERYVKLATDLRVQEYLIERHAIAGDPAECAAKIREMGELGATQILTPVRGPDYIGRMRLWHDLVMTRLP